MTQFYYHASHEQFPPSSLVRFAREAENAGFDGVFSSDHLQPWLPSQGQSGFMWSWLGAAMASTERIRFAGITTPGGARFHPLVVAQATATLCEMFPGRLAFLAMGSGEALNERPFRGHWSSDRTERRQRLQAGFDMVRRLLRGEAVTTSAPIPAANARLWTLPAILPTLVGAAISEATASFVGAFAEGLLTVGTEATLVARKLAAFRAGGGAGEPVHLKIDVSLGRSEAAARESALREWRVSVLPPSALADLREPEDFAAAAASVGAADMEKVVIAGSSAARFVEALKPFVALGIDVINLHNVGPNQSEFIHLFGREVLPRLRG